MYGFGNILRNYLEYYKISQSDFADRLGITQKHMNEIINGKTSISLELMVVISLLTDIDVNLIYSAEREKETYEKLIKEYNTKSEINKVLNSYGLKEMKERNWIKLKEQSSFVQNYIDLSDYMNINSIDNIENYLNKRYLFKTVNEKLSQSNKIKIFLWVRHCDILTKGIEIGEYDSNRLNDLLKELKEERIKKFDKDRLVKLFHKYGIILCIEDALKGSKVRGCIKVMINTPAIYMTTYYKEKSSFYYTLYHELMHLKSDYNKLKSKTMVIEDEKEMDTLALDEMINNDIYKKILDNRKDEKNICKDNKIPLCFLYTRLAYDKIINYNSKEYIDNIEKI